MKSRDQSVRVGLFSFPISRHMLVTGDRGTAPKSRRQLLDHLSNHFLDFAERDALRRRREIAVGQLPGGLPEVAHHSSVEGHAQTDALDAGLLELAPRQRPRIVPTTRFTGLGPRPSRLP